jgi:hypothetical protein
VAPIERGENIVGILEAEPRGWGSWSTVITTAGQPVTELKISLFRSRGRFQLDGQEFSIEPSGFFHQSASLLRRGGVIAKSEKTSFFRRRFVITSAGHRMELKSFGWWGREYELLMGGQQVGRVTRKGMTGRKMSLDFPDDVPVVLQVFLAYLVLCQVKREAARSAGG